jgi:hypothetical protein
MNPPTWFFFIKIVLDHSGILVFPCELYKQFSLFEKQPAGILLGIVSNLSTDLENIAL